MKRASIVGHGDDGQKSIYQESGEEIVVTTSVPLNPVQPTVADVPQSKMMADSGAVSTLEAFRVAIDAADPTHAKNMLADMLENVAEQNIGGTMVLEFGSPVSRIDILNVADIAVPVAGCIPIEATAAQVATAVPITFNFDPAVTRIAVSSLRAYATGQKSKLHIQGWAY